LALKDLVSTHEDERGQQQVGVTQWEIPFKVNKYIKESDVHPMANTTGDRILVFTFWSLEQASHSSAKPKTLKFATQPATG